MTLSKQITRSGGAALLAMVYFLGDGAESQVNDPSPVSLIRFLTYQDDRPGRIAALAGTSGCGFVKENRSAANALAKLGVSAVPNIEAALDTVEARGRQSEFAFNSEWLLLAYAKIEGRGAFTQLRRMSSNPRAAFLQYNLDQAIALSLGITSYASSLRRPSGTFHCSRLEEPRDALDRLIIAWERNDARRLEQGLGSQARSALDQLVEEKKWAGLRAEAWRGESKSILAVGYQFDALARWSEPEETLEQERGGYQGVPIAAQKLELDTLFKDSSGNDCGRYRVIFSKTQLGTTVGKSEVATYLVDNSDLLGLLRLVATCAEKTK